MVLDLSDNILRGRLDHLSCHILMFISPLLSTQSKILSQRCPWVGESSDEVFLMLWIKFLPAQKQETHTPWRGGIAIVKDNKASIFLFALLSNADKEEKH